MSTSTKVTQKCQSCGGNLIFNPSKKGLVCGRCGNFVPVNGTVTTEKSFQDLLNRAPTWQNDTTVFRCEHCGAKSMVSKFDLVVKCDYCGATDMVKTNEAPGQRPDTIVLFGLNRSEAGEKVRSWLSKRFFAPSRFKRQLKTRPLNGIYFPAFTFDAHVTTRYSGVLVHTDTVTTVVDGKEATQTQTTRRSINEIDTQTFDDMLILANDEIDAETLAQLQPFDTNYGQAFHQSYVAGFTIGGVSKEARKCWKEAKKSMESSIRDKINTRYSNGDEKLEKLQLELSFTNITYKYVLLPIYVGHGEYNGTQYPLYLNGQTGKVCGKTPMSWWKIALTFAAMGLMAFGAGIILAMFL